MTLNLSKHNAFTQLLWFMLVHRRRRRRRWTNIKPQLGEFMAFAGMSHYQCAYPNKQGMFTHGDSMLAHCLGRWPSIEATSDDVWCLLGTDLAWIHHVAGCSDKHTPGG